MIWGFLVAIVVISLAAIGAVLIAFQMAVRAMGGQTFSLKPKPIVPSTLRTPMQENAARKKAQMTELGKLESKVQLDE